MSKTSKIIILVIVTLVLVGAGYWKFAYKKTVLQVAKTEQTVKSEWKTYRNSEYGFEIKYPPHLLVNNMENSLGLSRTYVIELLDPNKDKYEHGLNILIETQPRKYQGRIYENSKIFFSSFTPDYEDSPQRIKTMVGNLDAFEYEYIGLQGGGRSMEFFNDENKLVYTISWTPSSDSILEKVAQTFKFSE